MKQSRRNVRNATAKAERRAEGKPALSSYARKNGQDAPPATSPKPAGGVRAG